MRPPSGWGRHKPKPANEVITDLGAAKPAIPVVPDPLDPNPNVNPENLSIKGKAKATSKPANEVITDSAVVPGPSACSVYREAIELGLSRGRNARAIWQDLELLTKPNSLCVPVHGVEPRTSPNEQQA